MTIANKTRTGAKTLIAAAAIALATAATAPAFAAGNARGGMERIISSLDPAGRYSTASRVERVDVVIGGLRTILSVDYGRALDLSIYFPYDSSNITKKAENQLNSLGLALMSPRLKSYRFLIAGHTDTAGAADYNQKLSMRRATAVRDYLVRRFGISSRRLVVAGWGERRLKDEFDPESSANRRVEVALVVSRKTLKSVCPEGTVLSDMRRSDMDLDDFGPGLTKPRCVLRSTGAPVDRYDDGDDDYDYDPRYD